MKWPWIVSGKRYAEVLRLYVGQLREVQSLTDQTARLGNKVDQYNIILARLLGKLDPHLTRDEFAKETMDESDRIGEQVIKRLVAEHKARQHTEGK